MNKIIRLADDKDKDEILSLLNNVFSEKQRTSILREEQYWNWKFKEGPWGKSILTIAEIDKKIVGVDNLWPWELKLRNQTIKALQPCDSVVDKDFRGQGIFKLMRLHGLKKAQEQNFNLLFNYPNKNSLPLNISLGYHFQGKIPWRVKIFKPVNIIQGMFSDNKTESVTIDNLYQLDIDLINEVAQKDDSFDQYIKINRVPGFHEWRYLNHPHRSYGMVMYGKGYKRTIVIFTINKKGESSEMVVVDIIGSNEYIIPVIKKVTEAGKKMNVSFIAMMDNPKYKTSELWKIGFFKRRFKNMVVLPFDLRLENIVKGYSNWSLMAGLHDSI